MASTFKPAADVKTPVLPEAKGDNRPADTKGAHLSIFGPTWSLSKEPAFGNVLANLGINR